MNKSQQLVHFASTGPNFPYYSYLGIMTALKVYGNKVRLWITEEPNSEYFEALKGRVKIINVPAEDIPEFPALANRSRWGESENDYFKRVAVFDYLIWDIVYKFGGMIMGLDSLTLKSHFDLLEDGKELMASQLPEFSFAMHGVIVRKGSKLAKLIINDALQALNSPDIKWGEAGIKPFENRCKQNLDKISISPLGLCIVLSGGLFRSDIQLDPNVRTIALAVGASCSLRRLSRHFMRTLDEVFIAQSDSLYAELVKETLSEEEWNGPFELDKSSDYKEVRN